MTHCDSNEDYNPGLAKCSQGLLVERTWGIGGGEGQLGHGSADSSPLGRIAPAVAYALLRMKSGARGVLGGLIGWSVVVGEDEYRKVRCRGFCLELRCCDSWWDCGGIVYYCCL